MDKTQKINTRAIVSMLLFFIIIILFVTAVAIQIVELFIDPEMLIAELLNPDNPPPGILLESMHILTAIHAVGGLIFCVLSIVHIMKNWKTLKTYFRNNVIKR